MRFVAMLALVVWAQDTGRTRSVSPASGEAVPIEVPVSTLQRSLTTVVEFASEKGISSVVQAFSKDDVSLEVKHNRLFVKLLADVRGHVDVVGTSGALYRLHVSRAAGDGYDAFVSVAGAKPQDKKPSHPKSLELIKAMRLLRVPEGASVARADDVAYRAAEFEVAVLFVYEFDGLKGYVCRVSNRSRTESYDLDLSRFEADSLVLIGARDLRLPPSGGTLLYLVFHEGDGR